MPRTTVTDLAGDIHDDHAAAPELDKLRRRHPDQLEIVPGREQGGGAPLDRPGGWMVRVLSVNKLNKLNKRFPGWLYGSRTRAGR